MREGPLDEQRIRNYLVSIQRKRLSAAMHETSPVRYVHIDRPQAERAHHEVHAAYSAVRDLALYLGVEY